MVKPKIGFSYRFVHLFTYHPWLKIVSFLLAVIVWFYAKGEITRFPN
jgi:hypothetical protein